MEKYGISKEALAAIMAKDLEEMSEREKEIWRKEVMANINETT